MPVSCSCATMVSMNRFPSLLLGAGLALGVLSVAVGVGAVLDPPPETEIGRVLEVGERSTPGTDESPLPAPTEEPPETPETEPEPEVVPHRPVDVDDDDDDDDDDDGEDD